MQQFPQGIRPASDEIRNIQASQIWHDRTTAPKSPAIVFAEPSPAQQFLNPEQRGQLGAISGGINGPVSPQ